MELQEAAIVEDVLFVFMGCEGQYIRFAKGYDPNEERDRLTGPTFRILPGLDPSLQDLTQSMLKMATYYSALVAFVDVQSREQFGAVNHALCASIRKFLQDYLVMIAQLETQFLTSDTFTVHVLNIHTMSTSHLMLQLYSLAHELLKKNALLDDESESEDDDGDDYDEILRQLQDGGDLMPGNMTGKRICKGGVVLGLITSRLESMSGDPAARALLTSLLRDASKPYMVMLNEWLHHGGIHDPHAEFLIKEQKSIRRERLEQDYTDEYWERRYTMRDHDVPPQLQGVKDKVLLAGKYLNVVRECGGVDVSKVVKDVPTSFDDNRFLENVNNAYAHANESLMQLLLTTHALPDRLRSLKHYFFLDPSDYFSYFLELGASELRKPVKSVNTGKLQSLLDLVLRQPGSIVSLDPFKDDVKVEKNETPSYGRCSASSTSRASSRARRSSRWPTSPWRTIRTPSASRRCSSTTPCPSPCPSSSAARPSGATRPCSATSSPCATSSRSCQRRGRRRRAASAGRTGVPIASSRFGSVASGPCARGCSYSCSSCSTFAPRRSSSPTGQSSCRASRQRTTAARRAAAVQGAATGLWTS